MIVYTCFLIDLMRADSGALQALQKLERGSEPLRVPTVVLYELWEGIERCSTPIRELRAVEAILASHPTVDLSAAAAKRARRLSAQLARRGEVVDDLDILIAGCALQEGDALLTRNLAHFERVTDLRVHPY